MQRVQQLLAGMFAVYALYRTRSACTVAVVGSGIDFITAGLDFWHCPSVCNVDFDNADGDEDSVHTGMAESAAR